MLEFLALLEVSTEENRFNLPPTPKPSQMLAHFVTVTKLKGALIHLYLAHP
jgi:hypothetical protein